MWEASHAADAGREALPSPTDRLGMTGYREWREDSECCAMKVGSDPQQLQRELQPHREVAHPFGDILKNQQPEDADDQIPDRSHHPGSRAGVACCAGRLRSP